MRTCKVRGGRARRKGRYCGVHTGLSLWAGVLRRAQIISAEGSAGHAHPDKKTRTLCRVLESGRNNPESVTDLEFDRRAFGPILRRLRRSEHLAGDARGACGAERRKHRCAGARATPCSLSGDYQDARRRFEPFRAAATGAQCSRFTPKSAETGRQRRTSQRYAPPAARQTTMFNSPAQFIIYPNKAVVGLARSLCDDNRHRTWFVDLAPLSDSTLVLPTLAKTIGAANESGTGIDAITSFIASAPMLIIFDNCEHLAEECGRVAGALLNACGNIRILATSCEPLQSAGESISLAIARRTAERLSNRPGGIDDLQRYRTVPRTRDDKWYEVEGYQRERSEQKIYEMLVTSLSARLVETEQRSLMVHGSRLTERKLRMRR
jgi:hypothetical protein